MSASQLKSLQTKRTTLLSQLEQKEAEREKLIGEITEIRAQVVSTEQEIEELQAAAPIVSEHATLRYLERVKGVDLNAINKEILELGSLTNEKTKAFKDGTFNIGNGFVAVVKNRTIVTIKEKHKSKPLRTGKPKWEQEYIDAN